MSSVLASHPDDGDNVSTDGTLFRGIRFWIAQRLPMRSSFVDKVKMNGGLMVGLEKSADILIVDHLRKDNPPDSFSYRWIEQSIKNGVLEDKEDHRAEPTQGYVRPVGSWKPAKSSRNPYTAGDDRILYDWVTDQEKKGGKVLGNEIYKQLEQQVCARLAASLATLLNSSRTHVIRGSLGAIAGSNMLATKHHSPPPPLVLHLLFLLLETIIPASRLL